MKILHVVGARPNFMKAAPVLRGIGLRNRHSQELIHTGQHYDFNMSDIFFSQLTLPEPQIHLGVGSATHTVQTAQIMIRFEKALSELMPDLVLVYGDVNSTLAAALVCAKALIPVGHVEAGLRSFDRTMPEEINRLITDQVSKILFTPSKDANENLLREGVANGNIYLVGNVMIDTLVRLMPQAVKMWDRLSEDFSIRKRGYGLVTLHRPSNVDEPEALFKIMGTLEQISQEVTLVFPIHPRTRQHLNRSMFKIQNSKLILTEPLSYLEFLCLQKNAFFVITDSGGIQEETTFLGVPCLTVRENTERPITIEVGTNILVGQDMDRLKQEVENILNGHGKKGTVPPLWDGRAGERIAEKLDELFGYGA